MKPIYCFRPLCANCLPSRFAVHLPCGEGTLILLWSESRHSFCASSIEATWDIADHTASTHTQCWVYLTDSIIHRVIKSSFRYNIFHSYWPAFATIRNTWHIDGRHTNTSISSGRNFGFVSSFSALWKCLTKSGTQFTGNFETWINNYMHGERVRVGYILANWSYTWAWRFEMDSHKHTKSCRHYRTRPMTDVCSFTCFPH